MLIASTGELRSPRPRSPGRRLLRKYDLAAIARYIDWSPCFQTWESRRKLSERILEDAVVGEAARDVLREASDARVASSGEVVEANAVFGLYPAASIGDDIEIYRDESREETAMVWHCLRRRPNKAADGRILCLADFVAAGGLRASPTPSAPLP